ncbi:ABC transporter substrate-binding protein [Granulicella sp. 5B5]|uniref:ABC transporter substrate-binding protein n=1 Tax=Granulicella sp. 5B5 TaxID=1617967 RepID=UPI0015F75D48|nr:ABC transporter substrate-binding protein [Granulicella sp. 5B5]
MTRTIACRIGFGVCYFLSTGALAQSAKPVPLTVQLDWKSTAQFAGILAAQEQGYYAAEGLAVTIRPDDGSGPASVDIVAAHTGDADGWVGITEADQLLAADAKGAHLKAFATMMQSTPLALLTLKSSGLTTIKSLRGKTIGLHDDGEKALDVLMQFNGMTRADVRPVTIGYEFDSLLSGKVAAMQGYTNDEVVRLEMEGHPVNVIPMSANGYVAYAEVLFAPARFVATHVGELEKFVRATGRGWSYARAHEGETARMIVAKYATDSSVAEQRASLEQTLRLVYAESPRFGMMRDATWRRSVEMFTKYKLVEGELRVGDVVDDEVLRGLYAGGH